MSTAGNRSLRVMQPADNTDFEVQAKFEALLPEGRQSHGLVAEESASRYVWVGFESDGNATRLKAASVVAGATALRLAVDVAAYEPQYLRVRRQGTNWTISFSADASTWTTAGTFSFSLAVGSVGVFAANAAASDGTIPPHTAVVDYFMNLADPLVPEDTGAPVGGTAIGALSVTPEKRGAVFSWTTGLPAASRIDVGRTAAYRGSSIVDPVAVTAHLLRLTGLDADMTYHARLWATDEQGRERRTGDIVFRTLPASLQPESDDFNSCSLDADRWTFFDPLRTPASPSSTKARTTLACRSRYRAVASTIYLPAKVTMRRESCRR